MAKYKWWKHKKYKSISVIGSDFSRFRNSEIDIQEYLIPENHILDHRIIEIKWNEILIAQAYRLPDNSITMYQMLQMNAGDLLNINGYNIYIPRTGVYNIQLIHNHLRLEARITGEEDNVREYQFEGTDAELARSETVSIERQRHTMGF